jgi:hypothetical protein
MQSKRLGHNISFHDTLDQMQHNILQDRPIFSLELKKGMLSLLLF